MVRAIILYFFISIPIISFSQINNLKHTEGYETGPYGELGGVRKVGNGERSMILIAGWGFDEKVFEPFTSTQQDQYTMYVLTLPGFGNTPAMAMPGNNEQYGNLYWTQGIIIAIMDLIERESIDKPILMSYFTYSNIIALRIALDYPELIDKVIIVSGMARFMANYPSFEPASLRERIYYTEKVLAPNWFKTVSKETWDEGNFTPEGFSKDTVRAQEFWKQMSSVPIPVMVRYLCEYYCIDLSLEYEKLKVPTLVVIPSFTENVTSKPTNYYWNSFFHDSWWGTKPANDNFHLITISESNAFILEDQPEKLIEVVNLFIDEKLDRYDLMR